MVGERDLDRLLAALSPTLAEPRYSFEQIELGDLPPAVFALVREAEGDGVVIERPDGGWARITLQVHSSVEAVGLTAELTRRLAVEGISANVIAGLRHDHFFVPWSRRDDALTAIGGR